MSVEALALVLHHSKASGTPKVVLLGIANHDGDGGAWPSVDTLAKYARVDRRAVQRAVASLVAAGEVRVEPQAGGTPDTRADRRPNRYTILLACPAECDGTANHRLNDGAAQVTPRAAPRGGVSDAHGAAPRPPEPSLEPSSNAGAKSTRARNPYFDALVEVFGPADTQSAATFIAKYAHELKAAGATPEQIVERGRRMRARGGLWAEATPAALAKHWTALGRGAPRSVHDQVSGVAE